MIDIKKEITKNKLLGRTSFMVEGTNYGVSFEDEEYYIYIYNLNSFNSISLSLDNYMRLPRYFGLSVVNNVVYICDECENIIEMYSSNGYSSYMYDQDFIYCIEDNYIGDLKRIVVFDRGYSKKEM